MKNILIALFSFITIFANAQFGIGPKLGVEFSGDIHLDYSPYIVENQKTFIGSSYGLSLMLGRGPIFHFQPEFVYYQIGSKYYLADKNITYTQKRNYVGTNFLFDIGFTKDNFRFYGQPGFYIAYLTNGLLETNDNGTITYGEMHSNNSIYGNTGLPVDFGFSFGIGIGYKIGKGWLNFNPKFRFGILPHSLDSYGSGIMYLNKSYTFNLSYIFIIGDSYY